jgi:hypothetical protein
MSMLKPIPSYPEQAHRQLVGTIRRFERPKRRGRPLTWNHVTGAAEHARRSGVPEMVIAAELNAAREAASQRHG